MKHDAEIAERRDGERHIGEPQRLEAGAGVVRRRVARRDQLSLEPRKTVFGYRRQELAAAGEMVIGSARTDARARRELTQAQRVDPMFGDRFDRRLDQRLTQIAMMVVGLPFARMGP